jgi:hypothetical protein
VADDSGEAQRVPAIARWKSCGWKKRHVNLHINEALYPDHQPSQTAAPADTSERRAGIKQRGRHEPARWHRARPGCAQPVAAVDQAPIYMLLNGKAPCEQKQQDPWAGMAWEALCSAAKRGTDGMFDQKPS